MYLEGLMLEKRSFSDIVCLSKGVKRIPVDPSHVIIGNGMREREREREILYVEFSKECKNKNKKLSICF